MYNDNPPAGKPTGATEVTMFFKADRAGVAAFARLQLDWPRPAWSDYSAWLKRHGPLMQMVGQLAGLAAAAIR